MDSGSEGAEGGVAGGAGVRARLTRVFNYKVILILHRPGLCVGVGVLGLADGGCVYLGLGAPLADECGAGYALPGGGGGGCGCGGVCVA